MARRKCILIKLAETPKRVKIRVVGYPRRKSARNCVFVRVPYGIGWKKVYCCDDYDAALAFLEQVIKELQIK